MNIKQQRERAGLTQSELADLVMVTTRTVERWEAGHRVPSAAMLELIRIKLSELERVTGRVVCLDSGIEHQKLEIPFMGFYETVLDMHLQNELEQSELDIDAVDWAATRLRIARAYAETWLHKMGLIGEFVEMLSPREYNFETDRLVVTVEHDARLRELAGIAGSRDFATWVAENYSTRSGFVSFVDPVATWGDELDSKAYTLIFRYLEVTEWPEMPEQIIDELLSNGGFELNEKE